MAYVPQAQVMEFAYTVLDLVLMGRTAHLGPFAAPRAAIASGPARRSPISASWASRTPRPTASPAASASSAWWPARWRRTRRCW